MQSLIMVPGLGSDGAVWQRTITALDGAFDCVVGDTLSDTSLPAMARRILARAPERFALAGVSMGGMVALELLTIAPERVTHVALVDTNARPDSFGRKAYRGLANLVVGVTRDFRRVAERSIPSLVHSATTDDVRKELVDMSVRVGPEAYVRQNRAVIKRRDLRSVLPGIAVPTVVVVGQDDLLTPVAMAREIQRMTLGSTLHVLPDCGHLPPIEKPQAMASLLRELLTQGRSVSL
jgi:pimeloyl-ACP methyl ester carboxylesterase